MTWEEKLQLQFYQSENYIVTWDDVRAKVWVLFEQLQDEPIDLIVGISRGGLIPGVMLSHKLDVPFTPLQWQTRDDTMERDFLSLVQLGKLKETGPKNILFVDDICDTGKTINEIRSQVPNGRWAVLYSKMDNMGIDFIGKRVYNVNKWIVFPWEKQ